MKQLQDVPFIAYDIDTSDPVFNCGYRITVREGRIVRIIRFIPGSFDEYHVKILDLNLGDCGPLDEPDMFGRKIYYTYLDNSGKETYDLCRLKEDSDADFFSISIDAIKALASFSLDELNNLKSILYGDGALQNYCDAFR